jgi:hypothetical protein
VASQGSFIVAGLIFVFYSEFAIGLLSGYTRYPQIKGFSNLIMIVILVLLMSSFVVFGHRVALYYRVRKSVRELLGILMTDMHEDRIKLSDDFFQKAFSGFSMYEPRVRTAGNYDSKILLLRLKSWGNFLLPVFIASANHLTAFLILNRVIAAPGLLIFSKLVLLGIILAFYRLFHISNKEEEYVDTGVTFVAAFFAIGTFVLSFFIHWGMSN